MKIEGLEIEWLGHDCFLIMANHTAICFDPYEVSTSKKADYIFVSHEHFDHLSLPDIKELSKSDTKIIAAKNCESKLKLPNTIFLKPNQSQKISELFVETIPAYNPGKKFHPKNYDGIGFIVTFAGKRIYHAGDTDVIPEMKQLKSIDIAFLPVSGTYVMNAKEAVEAAEIIKPKIVIPMHFGKIVGSKADAEEFARLYHGKTIIP